MKYLTHCIDCGKNGFNSEYDNSNSKTNEECFFILTYVLSVIVKVKLVTATVFWLYFGLRSKTRIFVATAKSRRDCFKDFLKYPESAGHLIKYKLLYRIELFSGMSCNFELCSNHK